MQMTHQGVLPKGGGLALRCVVPGAATSSSEGDGGMEGSASVHTSVQVPGGCQGALPHPSPLL